MNHLLYVMPEFVRTWWVELLCAALIVLIVPLMTGYIVLVERRVLAGVGERLGTEGLLQSISAAIQLLLKKDSIPDGADHLIFWFAPVVAMAAAITAMGALAFGPWFQVGRDINIGLLFVVGFSALAPIGVVLGTWGPSNLHSIFGALRGTAQLISFEIAAAFALVSGFLLAGTLKVSAIVLQQFADHVWFVFLAPAGFFIYFIATIVGMDRAPFDSAEAASNPADGEQVEYGGMRSSLYFLAEHANIIVIASVGTTLFLGGWLRPFPNVHWLGWLDALPVLVLVALGIHWASSAGKQSGSAQAGLAWVVALACFAAALILVLAAPFTWAPLRIIYPGLYGAFWFLLRVTAYIYIFLWLRFTLPRFRFEQLMRFGWHILIPLALVNVMGVGVALALQSGLGWNRWLAVLLTTMLILFVAVLLFRWNNQQAAAASADPSADTLPVEDSFAG
jgi:NADH-quinone oxidoreductase subunit H